jgi:hypothetical protein
MGTAEAIAMMMIVIANSFAIAVSPDQLAFMPRTFAGRLHELYSTRSAARLDGFYFAL